MLYQIPTPKILRNKCQRNFKLEKEKTIIKTKVVMEAGRFLYNYIGIIYRDTSFLLGFFSLE
jgi:hypothetical protein